MSQAHTQTQPPSAAPATHLRLDHNRLFVLTHRRRRLLHRPQRVLQRQLRLDLQARRGRAGVGMQDGQDRGCVLCILAYGRQDALFVGGQRAGVVAGAVGLIALRLELLRRRRHSSAVGGGGGGSCACTPSRALPSRFVCVRHATQQLPGLCKRLELAHRRGWVGKGGCPAPASGIYGAEGSLQVHAQPPQRIEQRQARCAAASRFPPPPPASRVRKDACAWDSLATRDCLMPVHRGWLAFTTRGF